MDSNEFDADSAAEAKKIEQFLPHGILLKKWGKESDFHHMLKNLVYNFLIDVDCKDVKQEVSLGRLRFDLMGYNPNGTSFGVEIGDINIPSIKLKQRIKESFKYVDMIFWIPFNLSGYLRFADVLQCCACDDEHQDCVDGFFGDKEIGIENQFEFKTGQHFFCFYKLSAEVGFKDKQNETNLKAE